MTRARLSIQALVLAFFVGWIGGKVLSGCAVVASEELSPPVLLLPCSSTVLLGCAVSADALLAEPFS